MYAGEAHPHSILTSFVKICIYIFYHLWYAQFMKKYLELTRLDLDTQLKLLAAYKAHRATLPKYNMIRQTIRGKERYYLLKGKKRCYLSADKTEIIENVKTQHFLSAAIKILERNIALQKKLLQEYKSYDYDYVNSVLPKAYRMSAPKAAAPRKAPENILLHRTSFGLYVRSKSEAIIAEVLHSEGIPFEYEMPLALFDNKRKVTLHPDFTFVTEAGEKIYWEHMGMVTNDSYREKAMKKLALYLDNGFTIPNELIITMDTKDGAIDIASIKSLASSLALFLPI